MGPVLQEITDWADAQDGSMMARNGISMRHPQAQMPNVKSTLPISTSVICSSKDARWVPVKPFPIARFFFTGDSAQGLAVPLGPAGHMTSHFHCHYAKTPCTSFSWSADG